jgi:thiol-disulfide isomerase/thioredoxin
MNFKTLLVILKTAVCTLVLSAAVLQTPAQQKTVVTKPAANQNAATKAAIGPKITVLDLDGLKKLIQPGSKPLMINFWATWCDPCREEFPDLVRLNQQYKGKIDFVTISLDDLADIDRDVPKFLTQMKADMPAYLLHAADEDAAISLVSSEWGGNLPLTIIYRPNGETVYLRKGKVHIDDVTAALDKLLAPVASGQ